MLKIVSYKYMKFWSWIMKKPNNVFAAQSVAGLPIVVFRDKKASNNNIIINHEKIHMKQAFYLLYIIFWLIYIGHFLINLFKYSTPTEAYRNIVFEKEAYDNDKNFNYLDTRKPYAWINYFK